MKSKKDLWLERFADVIQTGRVGKDDARKKLALAERNLERAARNLDADPDLALISAETAIVNAADAFLARDGYRIRGKTGAHDARMRYPDLPDQFVTEAGALNGHGAFARLRCTTSLTSCPRRSQPSY